MHIFHYLSSIRWINFFCSFQKECCAYSNKPAKCIYHAFIYGHQQVFRQTGGVFKKLQRIPGNSKIFEKYFWMNSIFFKKMQFFSMQLYFHRENEINKTSPQVSFKYFLKVLLASAFFHHKSANFAISRNTDIDCILIHNF